MADMQWLYSSTSVLCSLVLCPLLHTSISLKIYLPHLQDALPLIFTISWHWDQNSLYSKIIPALSFHMILLACFDPTHLSQVKICLSSFLNIMKHWILKKWVANLVIVGQHKSLLPLVLISSRIKAKQDYKWTWFSF